MECADCGERLADFLLDELPEHEAVLVQEHLALCPSCKETYRQLKGTGRALEAVPALQAVQPSPEFDGRVKAAAHVESEKILLSLPPEKRLRVELRRSQRLSRMAPAPAPPPPPASSRYRLALALGAAGVALVVLLLVYPFNGGGTPSPVGEFTRCAGKVEQFYRKAHEQWSPVTAGQRVQTGDEIAAAEDGRARLDLPGGGAVFLGPSCDLRFDYPKSPEQALVVELRGGELGLERLNGTPGTWQVRAEGLTVELPAGAQVYLRVKKDSPDAQVGLVRGQAKVTWTRRPVQEVPAGTRVTNAHPEPETVPPAELLPLWRADLISDDEAARWLGGRAHVTGPKAGGVGVELQYGFGSAAGLADWSADKSGQALQLTAGGALRVPPDARFALIAPLAPPLTLEACVSAETPRGANWALAVLETKEGGVTVDLGAEAQLQAWQKDHTRTTRPGLKRNPQAPERIRLEVDWSGPELQARLSVFADKTLTDKTQPLPLPLAFQAGGDVWLKALGEGVVLDGLRLTGVLPREWLRQRLAGAKP